MSISKPDFTHIIAEYLANDNCPELSFDNDDEYAPFDEYIDKQISDGSIVKLDTWSFIGTGWADKINAKLVDMNSSLQLVSVSSTDARISTKIKGQGVYFIITDNNIDIGFLILSWSYSPCYVEFF